MTRRQRYLMLSATSLSLLVGFAAEGYTEQQWPGRCKAIEYCGIGQPPGSCGSYCAIDGTGDFCVTNSPFKQC